MKYWVEWSMRILSWINELPNSWVELSWTGTVNHQCQTRTWGTTWCLNTHTHTHTHHACTHTHTHTITHTHNHTHTCITFTVKELSLTLCTDQIWFENNILCCRFIMHFILGKKTKKSPKKAWRAGGEGGYRWQPWRHWEGRGRNRWYGWRSFQQCCWRWYPHRHFRTVQRLESFNTWPDSAITAEPAQALRKQNASYCFIFCHIFENANNMLILCQCFVTLMHANFSNKSRTVCMCVCVCVCVAGSLNIGIHRPLIPPSV